MRSITPYEIKLRLDTSFRKVKRICTGPDKNLETFFRMKKYLKFTNNADKPISRKEANPAKVDSYITVTI